jgi:hypothetical protein
MKFPIKYLDSLAGEHKRVLVFDCEFWHVLAKSREKMYVLQGKDTFFFIPREIGGFFLEKVGKQWKLGKPFFVTFEKPQRDTVLPISHYSTVTPQTAYKLDEIEKNLGLPWGEAFYSKLSSSGQKFYNEGMEIYHKDKNIKKHQKSSEWYNTFMDKYSKSLIIVKGRGDIEALENASKVYNFPYMNPLNIIDIADWNEESKKLCQTAKLAGTFDCIKKYLDNDSKTIADFLPLEKAHDPSTDASMTLLVALYIESKK